MVEGLLVLSYLLNSPSSIIVSSRSFLELSTLIDFMVQVDVTLFSFVDLCNSQLRRDFSKVMDLLSKLCDLDS